MLEDTDKRHEPAVTARPLRMVFVSWEFPPQYGGGIGTYVDAITRGLAQRGHDLTVLTVGDQPYPTREITAGVTVLRLPPPLRACREAFDTLRGWQARSDWVDRVLRQLIRPGDVDLIEFCDYRGEGATFLTTCPAEVRPVTVVRLHTPLNVIYNYNTGHARQLTLEAYEKEAILAADRLVSPSRALAQQMQVCLGPEQRIDISPHPVDPAFLNTAVDEADSNEVLYVGRFEERKGVETLAQAATAFFEACPDARLVMVGRDVPKSSAEPSMRAVVRATVPARFHARLELLDSMPREPLRARFLGARLCVFPSHFENFPNTCLEAMALGRCVIGTAATGMAEMIVDGESGLIVPPADANALSAAMVRAFQMSTEERAAMGAAARDRVLEKYTPEVIAKEVENLYAGYVGERAVPANVQRATVDETASVAVVIPCYNHGKYLRDALASVAAQTYANVTCVVVDDGSTDPETQQVLEDVARAGTRVIRQENQGLAAARNTGVRATDASFYVPLDADDTLAPTFVEQLVAPLLADPTLGYVYSHVQYFGAAEGAWNCPAYEPLRLLVENLSVATAVVRRTAFEQVGGYNPAMKDGFEDWDFWIALLELGYQGRCVTEPLFHYRKHTQGSMLSDTREKRAGLVQTMVENHRPLFTEALDTAVAKKDEMFFRAHLDAWALQQVNARLRAEQGLLDEDEHAAEQDAAYELAHIENSQFWRLMRVLKRNPLYRALARLRFGAGWEATSDADDVRTRLARVKASRSYRVVQWIKAWGLYRWYARRRYGPQTEETPALRR